MARKSHARITDIWFGDKMTSIAGSSLSGVDVATWLAQANTKKIGCVHEGTISLGGDAADRKEFRCAQDRQVYYVDATEGISEITFSLAVYDYFDKQMLQGGTATATTWAKTTANELIYKTMVAKTGDGMYIVYPNAFVTATDTLIEDTILGIEVTSSPLITSIEGIPTQFWCDESEVTTGASGASLETETKSAKKS